MALKRHQYPRSKASVKAEGRAAAARSSPARPGAEPHEPPQPGAPEPPPAGPLEQQPVTSIASSPASSGTTATSGTTAMSSTTVTSASAQALTSLSPSAVTPSQAGGLSSAKELTVRLLDYTNVREVRTFLTLLHAIGAEADAYYFDKTPELIDRALIKARREENPSNTFAGLALARGTMVAVHVLRRFEEGPLVGAQVSGLWVAPDWRRQGLARRLKAMGEAWARSIGAHFLNSNVLSQNAPMLSLNRDLGFENYRINLRKRL